MKTRNVSFGSNLKELRKKYGYTRGKFADLIAFSENTIETGEYGRSLPAMETVCMIADFFGVTLDSLIYNQSPQINYLLGIDGGGTKTDFLLTDMSRREIARVQLGTSNPVDIGIEEVKKILEQGIHKVCSGINLREVSVFAGLSGGTTGGNREAIYEFLMSFNFGACANGSDMENVLEMVLGDSEGVAVIMGTGIISFAQSNGKRYRIGGWGYHIDKGGSGYNIASDAMYSALKHADGRSGSPVLKELIENRLGKPLEDSIAEIYEQGKAYIASFAPLVFEAYDRGDSFAKGIIDSNVREIAEIIQVALAYLPGGTGKVVLCGGLCKRKDILELIFQKYLSEKLAITFNAEAVVNGAVMLADKFKNGGKDNA